MRIPVLAAATLTLAISSAPASAASFWWGGLSEFKTEEKADVTLFWSHSNIGRNNKSSNPERYSKWKFCWRRKTNTSKGKNPCKYNSVIVTEPQVELAVPWDTVFKFQVEAYNLRREKWQTKSPTIIRPCFEAQIPGENLGSRCKG